MTNVVRKAISLLLLSWFLLPCLTNGWAALAARSWCLSMPGTTTEKLVANINYACGSGLADCRAIQEGGPCYSTDIIKVANYAMNVYYYSAGHEDFNCYFDGSGRIVYDDPSYEGCVYP
ncbi:glucan endo-1,3-beta-D-glucosidase-like [Zingiber officinale]|uniref:glucan endo-1,3-beta-D-glucosidase-like n=1 Tax=Zingiber officinale TaxID=94328 RepID=UPI001C4CD193|nr:glucan endo-1,3-beta-D-glucosidase-like [Zingiber officinale]